MWDMVKKRMLAQIQLETKTVIVAQAMKRTQARARVYGTSYVQR